MDPTSIPKRQRAGVLCIHQEHLLLVKLRDPLTRSSALYPPGGGIEPHETPAQAAEREAWEETGCRVQIDEHSEHIEKYLFTWNGRLTDCATHYFQATLLEEGQAPSDVEDIEILEGKEWVPLNELERHLSHAPDILNGVRRALKLS